MTRTNKPANGYVGRFAPSPTGPLHPGLLLTAVASYLQARSRGGRWLVRIEDIDTPRVVAGSAEAILRGLEAHGLAWDGEVVWQSQRHDAYFEALERLRDQDLTFPCACTRKQLRASRGEAEDAGYPGTCRQGMPPGATMRSLRLRVPDSTITITDAIQGHFGQNLQREVGDFILRRGDGIYSYQLAVVVDDAWQGVTEVVRGADLLPSTPRQVWLQRCLGYATPGYAHLPLLVDGTNIKLSKRTGAQAVDHKTPGTNLYQALCWLGQAPPAELAGGDGATVLGWARANWRLARVPTTSIRHDAGHSG